MNICSADSNVKRPRRGYTQPTCFALNTGPSKASTQQRVSIARAKLFRVFITYSAFAQVTLRTPLCRAYCPGSWRPRRCPHAALAYACDAREERHISCDTTYTRATGQCGSHATRHHLDLDQGSAHASHLLVTLLNLLMICDMSARAEVAGVGSVARVWVPDTSDRHNPTHPKHIRGTNPHRQVTALNSLASVTESIQGEILTCTCCTRGRSGACASRQGWPLRQLHAGAQVCITFARHGPDQHLMCTLQDTTWRPDTLFMQKQQAPTPCRWPSSWPQMPLCGK